jgi:hypothetical protein
MVLKKKMSRGFVILVSVGLVVSGCATNAETSTPIPTSVSQPTVSILATPAGSPLATPVAVYHPIASNECDDLIAAAATTLKASAVRSEADFTDAFGGGTGTACAITLSGTGADFKSFQDVAATLKAMLTAKGWTEDPQYQADGPTGTAVGLRNGNRLGLVSVQWQPSPDANCPTDQPISACQLKPEQQLYTITLDFAQK